MIAYEASLFSVSMPSTIYKLAGQPEDGFIMVVWLSERRKNGENVQFTAEW